MLFTHLLSVILIFNLGVSADDGEPLVVKLNQGSIRGRKDLSTKGKEFFSFHAIPYAKPPTDNLRFMKPEPADGWEGVRDASIEPSICAQLNIFALVTKWDKKYQGQEDCLVLNVYTPRISGDETLPVLVYFHGGAFVSGGHEGHEPHELLNEKVVLVVVQYRLGALGFLATEDGVIPGNQGLRDQTLALKWVNKNIASFSGDTEKITIFGISAGGASVHGHILSDYSNGLFSRAILQSGTLLCPWTKMTNPRKIAMTLGDHFDCFKDHPNLDERRRSEVLLKCLQDVDARELQLATHQFFKWSFLPIPTLPYVDGDYFAEDIEIMIKKGMSKNVSSIFGITKDEGSLIMNPILAMDEQRKAIKTKFSTIGPISLGFDEEENAEKISKIVYDYYVGGINNDIKSYQKLKKMFSHRHFAVCTDIAALNHAEQTQKSGISTFFYELHHRGMRTKNSLWGKHFASRLWVSHGDDQFYLFPVGKVRRNEVDATMREMFTKMWVNFADKGNPTPDSSLGFIWQPFTPENPKHLKLMPEPMMESDLRKKEREFWRNLPLKQNERFYGKETKENIKDEL